MVRPVPSPRRRAPALLPWAGPALVLAGCAGNPPLADLVRADQALDSAGRSPAVQYAPLELSTARTKLEQARTLATQEPRTARRLAEEATADAELAEARGHAEVSRESAAALRESTEAVEEEATRTIPRGR